MSKIVKIELGKLIKTSNFRRKYVVLYIYSDVKVWLITIIPTYYCIFNIERILLSLQIESGIKAEPKDTLVVFDEIQEAKRWLTSLKDFYENAPEYHIIAAGSYLGISMLKNASFPVDKFNFMYLR